VLPTGKNVSSESSLNWIQDSFHKVRSELGTLEVILRRAIHDPDYLLCGVAIFCYFCVMDKNWIKICILFVYSLFRVHNSYYAHRKKFRVEKHLKCAGHLISSYPRVYVTYINHVPFVLKRKFDFIHPHLVHQTGVEMPTDDIKFLYYSL